MARALSATRAVDDTTAMSAMRRKPIPDSSGQRKETDDADTKGDMRERLRRFRGPEPKSASITVRFDLFPSALLGVPEEGVQMAFPDGYPPSQAALAKMVDIPLRIGGFEAHLSGNTLSIVEIATDPETARVAVEPAVDRFLRFLTMQTGTRFFHRFKDAHGEGVSMSAGLVHTVTQNFFNAEVIIQAATLSARFSGTPDPDLDLALTYYDHALLLLDIANRVNSGFPKSFWQVERDYQAWLTDVILNLWKAQAQILGEGKRREKRMAILSLDPTVRRELEALDTLRDRGGVAHTRQKSSARRDLRVPMDKGRRAVEALTKAFASYSSTHGPLPF